MGGFLSSLRLGFGRPRVPLLLQTEAAECGLCSLAMVAAYHGLDTDMPTLRQRFQLSLKGATMVDLTRMAAQMQLNARALRAEMEHLPQLQMPCVLHWDLNHFVVLTDVRHGKAVIHDPARGVRHMAMDEVSKHFTGVVLELTPAAEFKPRVERQSITTRQMLGRVTGLKRSLLQIFTLALALEAFTLLSPFFMQWVVDGVLVGADRDLLLTLGLGFGLLVFIQVATGAIRSWAVLYLSSTLNLQWLSNVFAHLMRLPVAWFEKRHTGDVMSRFGAVQQIQQTLTTSFIEVVLDGLLVVLCRLALGLLPPAARGHRGSHHPRREEGEPLPRIAARGAVDQAVQPPGRPPGALHEPGGRRDERQHRHPQARPGVGCAAQAAFRARARGRGVGRRAAGAAA
jgi:ATP-binding cassette subfamily B protein RaxB